MIFSASSIRSFSPVLFTTSLRRKCLFWSWLISLANTPARLFCLWYLGCNPCRAWCTCNVNPERCRNRETLISSDSRSVDWKLKFSARYITEQDEKRSAVRTVKLHVCRCCLQKLSLCNSDRQCCYPITQPNTHFWKIGIVKTLLNMQWTLTNKKINC